MVSLFSVTACLLLLIAPIAISDASPSPSTSTQSHKPSLSNRKALLFHSTDAEDKSILVPKRELILKEQNKTKKSQKINPTASTAKIKLDKTIDETKFSKSISPHSSNAIKIQLKKSAISTPNPIKDKMAEKLKLNSTPISAKNQPRSHEESSDEQDPDLITEFRNLPARLQKTLLPDLERISITSKAYLSAANAGVMHTVTPFLDTKYAPQIAPLASALLIILTLLLFITIIRRLGSCLFLLRFVQAYLAIYFATLALVTVLTGQEPLRFFHVASPTAYTWTQLAQSIGYISYLLLQLSDLVVVFESPANGAVTRVLGLGQMAIGLGVGLHYYTTVFHQAATGEEPQATWQVHAVYAVCFLVISVCSRLDRRKKVYAGTEGEEDSKNS
ncbi:cell wall integrity/stress response component-like protein [Rhynchospora pubera]|uniref:Cell wall integrity/stress response component-like protein n=1 Tax=Rhynchospora pubera TaxID=906938 RepID=A0AAV8FAB3_9POAL|nr:cell wall integrity/stress response component-like protein [Rhynchospora pubera]